LEQTSQSRSVEHEQPLENLLLALVFHALRKEDEANERLSKVREWRGRAERGEVVAASWAERLEIEILFREASRKIE
jgi:hypothetical protein